MKEGGAEHPQREDWGGSASKLRHELLINVLVLAPVLALAAALALAAVHYRFVCQLWPVRNTAHQIFTPTGLKGVE